MIGMLIFISMDKYSIASKYKLNINIFSIFSIKNLLLRGCYLRNIDYCVGLVIYIGKESKIMKNAKKPPKKVSNIMIKMNYMLYTVFAFQLIIIIIYASLSVMWQDTLDHKIDANNKVAFTAKKYLNISNTETGL
jgi:magnesium-transporting ATPase (P-type)